MPHPDFGEAVIAVLLPAPGADPAGFDEAVRNAAQASLAAYKRPKEVILARSFPRNNMGKVQKHVLRDTYRGLFGGG